MSWWKFWDRSNDEEADDDDEYFNCSECGFLVNYDDSDGTVCYECLDKKGD